MWFRPQNQESLVNMPNHGSLYYKFSLCDLQVFPQRVKYHMDKCMSLRAHDMPARQISLS